MYDIAYPLLIHGLSGTASQLWHTGAPSTMPRMARVVAEAVPHHITQRGNNRQDTFFLPDDRSFYLETLRAKCRDHGVPAYWVIA